jgi:hypothetical protein
MPIQRRCPVCKLLCDGPRCPTHLTEYERDRTRRKRERRPYTRAEQTRRAESVSAHVAEHGWLCPGWRRPAHWVAEGDLTADHPHAVAAGGREDQQHAVMCRSCNSSKRDSE